MVSFQRRANKNNTDNFLFISGRNITFYDLETDVILILYISNWLAQFDITHSIR